MGRRRQLEVSKTETTLVRIGIPAANEAKRLGILKGGMGVGASIEYLISTYGKPEIHRLMREELKKADR